MKCIDPKELHCILVYSNSRRFNTRCSHMINCAKHIESFGVTVHVVETAFAHHCYDLDGHLPESVNYIKFRNNQEIWLKESMINAAVRKLPNDWKYVAFIDADIVFHNPHWVRDTLRQLQRHPVVQCFSEIIDLGPSGEVICRATGVTMDHSFCKQFYHAHCLPKDWQSGYYNSFWHPGFCWAATRAAWDTFGGLPYWGIAGNGDHMFACSLIGQPLKSLHGKVSDGFKDMTVTWANNCKPLHNRLGYVKGLITHQWHGSRANRQYQSRWQMLVDSKFDPYKDINFDSQGLIQLVDPYGRQLKLMQDLQVYMNSRDEDSTYTGEFTY